MTPSVSAHDHRLLRALHELPKQTIGLSCVKARGICTSACLVQQLMLYSWSQVSEEDVAHAVKQHLVKSLVSHGASDAVTNQASALRR